MEDCEIVKPLFLFILSYNQDVGGGDIRRRETSLSALRGSQKAPAPLAQSFITTNTRSSVFLSERVEELSAQLFSEPAGVKREY